VFRALKFFILKVCLGLIVISVDYFPVYAKVTRSAVPHNNFSRCLFVYTHYRYMFRPLLAIFRQNIQLIAGGYCTYNGSVVLCGLCIIKLQYVICLENPAVIN
jgi:hypothetical protein